MVTFDPKFLYVAILLNAALNVTRIMIYFTRLVSYLMTPMANQWIILILLDFFDMRH